MVLHFGEFRAALEYLRVGKMEAARETCRRIVASDSFPVEQIHALGHVAIEAGVEDVGVSLYRRAVVLQPDLGDELLQAAQSLAESGKTKEAIGTLRAIVHVPPEHVVAERLLDVLLSDPSVSYFRFLTAARIGLVFDIGADVGQFARGLRTMGYEGATVSVEPVATAFDELARISVHDPLWTAEHLALGVERAELTIHVPVDTFENLYRRHSHRGRRCMLKISGQGYEMKVLEGAGDLDAIALVHVALSSIPLHGGRASLPEVMLHLYERRFVLADIERCLFDQSTRQVLRLGWNVHEIVRAVDELPCLLESRARGRAGADAPALAQRSEFELILEGGCFGYRVCW